MHLNVYSNEGGVKSTEAGKKKAKDGKVYPFIAIYFENGNAIKFFGKTVEEVEGIVAKINEGLASLKMLSKYQKEMSDSMVQAAKIISPEFL